VGFDFPGRGTKYSELKYHWYHFTGVDFNAANGHKAIYKIVGEQSNGWAQTGDVDGEKGNYDYLMGSDLDYDHPEVEKDVVAWGTWLAKEMPLRGIRFDAIKHYSVEFLEKFVEALDENYGKGWFFVGEFWKDSLSDMVSVCCPPHLPEDTDGLQRAYLDRMNHKFSLFDAPLVYNFSEISKANGADLRKVFDHTLVQTDPVSAVVCSLFLWYNTPRANGICRPSS